MEVTRQSISSHSPPIIQIKSPVRQLLESELGFFFLSRKSVYSEPSH